MTLEELRHQIDAIDTQLLQLLAERFAIVEQIAPLKEQVEDTSREAAMKKRWQSIAKDLKIPETCTEQLLQLILAESKQQQHTLKQ